MRIIACLFLAAFCMLAQTGGITSTVSRTLIIPPDESQFAVDVNAPSATTVDQVVRALAGTGIQASDLVGQTIGGNGISFGGLGGEIAVPPIQAVRTTFSFAVTRPADALKSMVDKLEALRRQPPTGFSVQYGAALAPSANAVEELRRTVLPQLITEARRKAQNIAGAANLTLGAIESIGDVGIGSVGIYAAGRVLSVSSEFRSTFAITVRFAAR